VERGEIVTLLRMPGPGETVELVHCAARSVVGFAPASSAVYEPDADPNDHGLAPPRHIVLPALAELFGAGRDAAVIARFEEHCARHF
jgi:hypothetical protein